MGRRRRWCSPGAAKPLLQALEVPLESYSLLSTKCNVVLFTAWMRYRLQSHSWRKIKDQELTKKERKKEISKAIEDQHGVLNKDSSKKLEALHVCAHIYRKPCFASDQWHRTWAGLTQKSLARQTCCANANMSWPMIASLTSLLYNYSKAGSAVYLPVPINI